MQAVTAWRGSRLRVAAMLLALTAGIGYELARAYYRPYIYARGINDFHLADTLGNSLGTIATVLAFASLLGRDGARGIFVLRSALIGVLVYELLHPLLGKPVDPWDIGATLVAGAAAEQIYRWLGRRLAPPA